MKKNIICCIVWCIALTVFGAINANASLIVDPNVTEVSCPANGVYEGEFKIGNSGEHPMKVVVKPVNWLRRYLKRDDPVEVEEWLSFEVMEFTVEPQTLVHLPYKIKMPPGLSGEKVAQVFFEFHEVGDQTIAFLKKRLGVILYAGIEGTEQFGAVIDSFGITAIKNEEGETEIKAAIGVNNLGNVHCRPNGTIIIKKNKEEIARINVPKSKGIYNKTADILYTSHGPTKLEPGTYVAELYLDCGMYNKTHELKEVSNFTI